MGIIAEHPWIIGASLTTLAITLWMFGARRGSIPMLVLAAVALLATFAVATIAWIVETPSDHGELTVLALVAAAESADPQAATRLLAPTATIHMVSEENPGDDRDRIARAFDTFAERHRIEDNSIWSLEAFSTSPTSATIDITCRTRTATSLGTVPTQWTFEVEQQDDGSWKISRIVWRAVAGQRPSLSLF